MALEWSDLNVILAVARARSLSGAARMLGQNHSTVFRRIHAIEERTGVRFFVRLPSGYLATEAGQTALAYAERIESEVHALGREILGQDTRLQGKVRLTAPEGLATGLVPAMLAEFRRQHPEVTVELHGGTAALDLARREADVAVRATRKPPDASLGRRVCEFRFALYASPAYLKVHADKPAAEHDYCAIEGSLEWLAPHVWKKKSDAEARTVFVGSLTGSVQAAARAGLGLTLLPCYVGDADPGLQRASVPLEAATLELWLLTHTDLRHTARVKALLAFLHEAFSKQHSLFEGRRPRTRKRPPIQWA